MGVTVCLGANALYYAEGGGHLWVYLNWALALRAAGCRVIWLEAVGCPADAAEVRARVAALRGRLEPYGLGDALALYDSTGADLPCETTAGCLDLDAAAEADLFLNQCYDAPAAVVSRFRRSALLDIDPGLLQMWVSSGQVRLARHDVYFTIGETVGRPGARFPDLGLAWHYTPPCVALDWWPIARAGDGAPFTTVSHWYAEEWVRAPSGRVYRNDKRTGFLPYLDLPLRTSQPLELALCIGGDPDEYRLLGEKGWRVREAEEVASTPQGYQRYIQDSRGEFSGAKPSWIYLQNAWFSDRTACYLASGKPAVVQHTGPSRFLPDAAGLFRFRDLDEARRYVEAAAADYERQCRLARALAEEYFDGRKVIPAVLVRALS